MKHLLIGLTLMINTIVSNGGIAVSTTPRGFTASGIVFAQVVTGLTNGNKGTYTYSAYVPQDVTSILANSEQTFVSNGTNLYPSNQ